MTLLFKSDDAYFVEYLNYSDAIDGNERVIFRSKTRIAISSEVGVVESNGFLSSFDATIYDLGNGEEIFPDGVEFFRYVVRGDDGEVRNGIYASFSEIMGPGPLDFQEWLVPVLDDRLPEIAPGTNRDDLDILSIRNLSNQSEGPYAGGARIPLADFSGLERLPDFGGTPEIFPTPSLPELTPPDIAETLDADPLGGRLVGDPALNSLLVGSGGDDVLIDLGGDNIVEADEGSNRVATGAGADYILSGDLRDVVKSGAGADFIATRGGDDAILAGDGDDVIDAGGGADVIKSGDGNDLVVAGDGEDRILAGDGDDTVLGGVGNDVILPGRGDDLLLGQDGHDAIRGFRGDEILVGGEGDDTLLGGLDDDTLEGGAGNDRLGGGPGRDLFIFRDGAFGDDRIVDFRIGSDILDFRGSGLTFLDLTFSQRGGNAVISFEGTTATLVLGAVGAAELEAAGFDSFLF